MLTEDVYTDGSNRIFTSFIYLLCFRGDKLIVKNVDISKIYTLSPLSPRKKKKKMKNTGAYNIEEHDHTEYIAIKCLANKYASLYTKIKVKYALNNCIENQR